MALMSARRACSRWMSSATSFRLKIVLDKDVEDKINDAESNLKVRKHPGILNQGTVRLPSSFLSAVDIVVADKSLKDLTKNAKTLNDHLIYKKPPLTEADVEFLKSSVKERIMGENQIDVNELGQEEKKMVLNKMKSKYTKLLKQTAYKWKAVDYNEANALLYVFARAAPDFASLVRVFKEIQSRDPSFQPRNLFDFGSGIGMVTWAAREVWKNELTEMFCVDPSINMNNLALALMQGGKTVKEPFNWDQEFSMIKGLYFRQFMPTSAAIKYDLVVCAHTLMELPSAELRLQTAFNLWRKAGNYLVFVEHGSKAAHDVLMEVRDFLLTLEDNETGSALNGHVFAPCPHNSVCPLTMDISPCNFEVSYEPLLAKNDSQVQKERFSYVILKKGRRPESDPQWPRIIRPVVRPSKQNICRMCTKRGQYEEVIITKARHGMLTNQIAKKTNWGDLLPIHLIEPEKVEESEAVSTEDSDKVD